MGFLIGLAALVAVGAALIFVVPIARSLVRDLPSRAPGWERQASALCMGAYPRSVGLRRGNGRLGLTRDELVFVGVLQREWAIPFDWITGVELRSSFRGRWVARELLHVRFRGPASAEECKCAWVVPDPGGWAAGIQAQRGV